MKFFHFFAIIIGTYIIMIIIYYCNFCEFFTPVLIGRFYFFVSNNKSVQIFRSLVNILFDLRICCSRDYFSSKEFFTSSLANCLSLEFE